MIAPAPVIRSEDNFIIDDKFAEGMKLHASLWPGAFDCILREGSKNITFGTHAYDQRKHGFKLIVLGETEPLTPDHLRGYDLVFCSADDERNLDIPNLAREAGVKLATTLEYTLQTRLQIVFLDQDRSLLRKFYGWGKLLIIERRRRRFLKAMSGIQANGYPAFEQCKKIDPHTLLFLDNRMKSDFFASEAEMKAREAYLLGNNPLRLVYSGRLDFMKGAQDLIPIATRLRDFNVPFSLDIFGAGILQDEIKEDIRRHNLQDTVHMKGAVDFETELIPYLRQNSDIFLCCHGQSDPSCTYLENMGCGLAVMGYSNQMWSALCKESQAGWATQSGNLEQIATELSRVEKDRPGIVRRSRKAVEFARQHDFLTESKKRIEHLVGIARD